MLSVAARCQATYPALLEATLAHSSLAGSEGGGEPRNEVVQLASYRPAIWNNFLTRGPRESRPLSLQVARLRELSAK